VLRQLHIIIIIIIMMTAHGDDDDDDDAKMMRVIQRAGKLSLKTAPLSELWNRKRVLKYCHPPS
jgi:hypothetical protein